MSLTIRLERLGKKKQPYYRVVVTESTRPRQGRFVELLGYYNPLREPAVASLDEAKVREWLDRGAKPSDTVRSLLSSTGILERWTKGTPPSVARPHGPVPSGKPAVVGVGPAGGRSRARVKKAAAQEDQGAEAEPERPAAGEEERADLKAAAEHADSATADEGDEGEESDEGEEKAESA